MTSAPSESLATRLRKVNFARLNHVFIPSKKPDRDRLRGGLVGKGLRPLFAFSGWLGRDGRSLLVLTILVAAASLDVNESSVYLLFAALVGLFVGSLAVRPFFAMKGCTLEISTAPRVAVGEALELAVSIVNDGPSDVYCARVERPFLPWDGKWIGGPPTLAHVPRGGRATARVRATFVERGEHHLDAFEAGALAPLGLAVGPRIGSAGARFVVVPRPARVGRVTLAHRSPIRDGKAATYSVPGDGEIAGVRPYRFGDPLKHLHARTWARTGIPHVRHYADERADRVALILALDATTATEPVVEAAISLAAGIAGTLAGGDGPGLDHLVLGDRTIRVEPRRGRGALELCLDSLAKLVVDTRELDVAAHLAPLLPSISTVILLTSDHDSRRAALAESVARSGAPCNWIEVALGDEGGAPRVIAADRITRGEVVAC